MDSLWGSAVNYSPASFGRTTRNSTHRSSRSIPVPRCETPCLKNTFFTHRSMEPFITELAWTACELEHKQLLRRENTKWVILIFKKIMMKKGGTPLLTLLFGDSGALWAHDLLSFYKKQKQIKSKLVAYIVLVPCFWIKQWSGTTVCPDRLKKYNHFQLSFCCTLTSIKECRNTLCHLH